MTQRLKTIKLYCTRTKVTVLAYLDMIYILSMPVHMMSTGQGLAQQPLNYDAANMPLPSRPLPYICELFPWRLLIYVEKLTVAAS